MSKARRWVPVCALALPIALLGFAGCGNAPAGGASGSAPPPSPSARAATLASASALPPELKGPEYTENDFVESDRNRDPFRSFIAQNQVAKGPQKIQREVQFAQYSIDELKLVAIVMGSDKPRAMFIDPVGKGTVVYKGTFVCRPEIVHVGGSNGPEYQLNWRVDRIREGDVVLIREDPANPQIVPATRIVPLHPEQERDLEGFGVTG